MSLAKSIGKQKVNLEFNKDFIDLFNQKIKSNDIAFINKTFADYHPADIANLIENLDSDTRNKLIEIEAFNIEPEIFVELNESLQFEVLQLLKPESIAKILRNLESDNALQILEKLEETKKKNVLDKLSHQDRFLLQEGLSYPEDSAARIMQREFTAVPSEWTVGQTIDYLRESKELPEEFLEIFVVDKDFKPIDWHLDFKSGFRWPENRWYKNIQYRNIYGADAKVPWELARMHHFPTLAFAYGLAAAKRPGFRQKNIYATEFCNQLLDFFSANPPRYGINWCCTMDVAIRAANILVSYDLFRSYGYLFNNTFEKILWSSMLEHGRHVVSNLERDGNSRNNHYLANIVGLLFISSYLFDSSESNTWLTFAINSFIEEVQFQFFEEGANFEKSTSYHRLSAEMVLYGTALILALPEDRLKTLPSHKLTNKSESDILNRICRRLLSIAKFSIQTQTPAGRAIQIGDNDSGRFIKFFQTIDIISFSEAQKYYPNLANYSPPQDMVEYLVEDNLDHRHLCAGISALFGNSFLTDLPEANHPERDIILKLTNGTKLPYIPPSSAFNDSDATNCQEKGTENVQTEFMNAWNSSEKNARQKLCLKIPSIVEDSQIERIGYADFGVYIFRSPELHLIIRCGGDSTCFPTGHAHNDQLSIELWIKGECIIPDPGTFLYTPMPNERNLYRSIKSHFAPQITTQEPSNLGDGLFTLNQNTGAECLYFRKRGFIGRHKGFGPWVWRAIFFENNRKNYS